MSIVTDATPQAVARLIRHQVGDLLQSVYAAVAVLHERLPASSAVDRRILSDLKARAEQCRQEIDAIVDLVNGPPGQVGVVELDRLLGASLMQARQRFPSLTVDQERGPRLPIRADVGKASGAVSLLLRVLCGEARQKLSMRLGHAEGAARVTIRRDGPPPSPEQRQWAERPFSTTQNAGLGLAVASVARALRPGGGRVEVAAHDGGAEVVISSPLASEDSAP